MRNRHNYQSLVIVNRYAIDYLTITTWNRNQFLVLKEDCIQRIKKIGVTTDIRPKSYMQYAGHEIQGVFFGVGDQQGQEHYLLTAKGGYAEIISPIVYKIYKTQGGLSCTNIHLQVMSENSTMDFKSINRFLESPDCLWPARKLRTRSILDSTGLDTIYLGSQKGDSYALIYVKEYSQDKRGVRYEARFSRSHAQVVFDYLSHSSNVRADIARIRRGRWQKLPIELQDILTHNFRDVETFGDGSKGFIIQDDHTMKKRFDWFITCVSPAILTLLSSEFSEETKRELELLLKFATNV